MARFIYQKYTRKNIKMASKLKDTTTLREKEIRPSHLMQRQQVAVITDIGRLLSRYEEFVEVSCPACGSGNAKPKFKKNCISYVECKECETFYVNPRPPVEVLEWFYSGSPNYKYWNDVIFPESELVRRKKIFVPRVNRLLELCSKYGVEKENLLEVGAGFGTFCEELNSKGAFRRVVAVEPTPHLAETCRQRGLEVIEQPIEKISIETEGLFDVVASFEVIEHLFSPASFIDQMARMLKPGGLLILTCPNGKGFDISTLGPLSDTVDHEHLNYFNPNSAKKILEKFKLEVLECFTPGMMDVDLVRTKIRSGEFDSGSFPFLDVILNSNGDNLAMEFQQFLQLHGLSSNMWVVAKKR